MINLLQKKLTNKKSLQILLTIATFLISIGILVFLVYQQRDALQNFEWKIRMIPMILSFLVYSLDLFLVVGVWGSMMNDLGAIFGFRKHLKYYSIANLTKRIPGTVWYVASRAQFYKNDGISRRQTALASGVEMAISMVAGIIVSLIFGISIIAQFKVSYWVLLLGLLGSVSILHPKALGWIIKRIGIQNYNFKYRIIMKWILGYILIWLVGGVLLFFIANIFWELPYANLGYTIGSWTIVGVLSSLFLFSPSNLGITEVGLSLLLSTIMPSSVAVLVSIAVRILIFIYEIIWALISMIGKNF